MTRNVDALAGGIPGNMDAVTYVAAVRFDRSGYSSLRRGSLRMGHSVPLRKRPTDIRLWSDGHGASM